MHQFVNDPNSISAYQSAEPEDLWEALEAVSENQISILPTNTNLSDVMYNWIETSGYPVVNVTLNGTTITMTQVNILLAEYKSNS